MTIYNDVIELIGNTPLVRLNRVTEDPLGNVIAKLEFYNPANSAKDRTGNAIIDAAERSGELKPGRTIVEGTSGNTGIALAIVDAARSYEVILTMPDTVSQERRVVLRAFGTELVLTPGADGMRGAVDKANEIVTNTDNAILTSQFASPANPVIREATTGEKVWETTDGKVDYFVAGVGTGGTITGAGRTLKKYNSGIQLVAVELRSSPLLTEGTAGPHKIQGLGANFAPEALGQEFLNEIIAVTNEDAIEVSRKVAAAEDILGGISAGANIKAVLEIAVRPEAEGKNIVVIVPNFGEHYVSSVLYEDLRD